MPRRHVYGPVPSRRLGLSLGVDLVPHKVCSFDCVYCQLGFTTRHQTTREDFFPPGEILEHVADALVHGPAPDVVTLAGSGEPCLYRSLGRIIDGIHGLTDAPVVLITNGSLLYQDEVAAAAMATDILIPSLDAGDPETFARINQPASGLDFHRIVGGLQDVARRYQGSLRIEVMLVAGLNDSPESLRAMARILDDIPAQAIELNTPVRPVPKRGVEPLTRAQLEVAARYFGPRARVIGAYSGRMAEAGAGGADEILELLGRRPCTARDMETSLGMHGHQVSKALRLLLDQGKIVRDERGGEVFYKLP